MVRVVINVAIAILACLGVGLTARWFQSEALLIWYPTLIKSELSPPNIVFPIVWGIVYLCMGASIGLIYGDRAVNKSRQLTLFLVQLGLNFLWSFTFFYLRNPFLGLVNIVLLDVVVIWYAVSVYPIRRISSWLMVPYICWIIFATYLNAFIYMFN